MDASRAKSDAANLSQAVKGVPPMDHRSEAPEYDAPPMPEKKQYYWHNGARVEIDHGLAHRGTQAQPLKKARQLPRLAGGDYV